MIPTLRLGRDIETFGVLRCANTPYGADIVYQNPDGLVNITEIKTGNSSLSVRQSSIYPQIQNGDAIPMTDKLKRFDIRAGTPLKDQGYPNGINVYTVRFPGLQP